MPFGAKGLKMKLKKHIKDSHNNNLAAFARHIGSTYQQVQRWVKLDCIWHDGRVWAPKTK